MPTPMSAACKGSRADQHITRSDLQSIRLGSNRTESTPHLDHSDVVRTVADCQCNPFSACASFILLDHLRQLGLLSRRNTAADHLGEGEEESKGLVSKKAGFWLDRSDEMKPVWREPVQQPQCRYIMSTLSRVYGLATIAHSPHLYLLLLLLLLLTDLHFCVKI